MRPYIPLCLQCFPLINLVARFVSSLGVLLSLTPAELLYGFEYRACIFFCSLFALLWRTPYAGSGSGITITNQLNIIREILSIRHYRRSEYCQRRRLSRKRLCRWECSSGVYQIYFLNEQVVFWLDKVRTAFCFCKNEARNLLTSQPPR